MSDFTENWQAVPSPATERDAETMKQSAPPKGVTENEQNPVGVFYDGRTGKYYRKSEDGDFIVQNSQAVRRFLKSKGYSTKPPKNSDISQNEEIMEAIERRFSVDHVGAIAGKQAGFLLAGNTRILVTKSPALLTPRKGEWKNLKTLLETLLQGEQSEWFLGWMAWTVKALYDYKFRPGQAVVIAGPRSCGKTLLAQLITVLLGGRSANPSAFLSGETDFNGELAEAELLLIDDEANDSAPKTKKRLGAKLRGLVANRTQRIHPKGRAALTLTPFWRTIILLNDDPSSLSVLPQMEESLSDKISLLGASVATLPGDSSSHDFEEVLWKYLTDELPAFLFYLLNEHEVRDAWTDRRFGVTSYHEESVLELLEQPPEMELLNLIRSNWNALLRSQVESHDPLPPDFEGPACEIEAVLLREAPVVAKRAFYGSNVCGVLMGKLVTKHPKHFSRRILSGQTLWKILPSDQ